MSSQSIINIRLFDENSIARYYQLAALSVAFRRLPHIAVNMERGIVAGSIQLGMKDFVELFTVLADYLEKHVCFSKVGFAPTLYMKDLEKLRLVGIQFSKQLKCGDLVNYIKTNTYMQYLNTTVDIPILLRAYVFSYYRGREKVGKTDSPSLCLALIGLFITAVARVVKAGEVYELYINPDMSLNTFREAYRFYDLLNNPGSNVRPQQVISNMLDLEGLSLELVALLSIALYVTHVARRVLGLTTLSGYYNVFERFRLICIKPEERPYTIWERPLTLTHVLERLEKLGALDLLDRLDSSVEHARRLSKEVEEYPKLVSACVNDLYRFVETGSLDMLTHCASGLARLYDKLDVLCRKGDNVACKAYSNIDLLVQHIARLGLV